MEKFIEITEVSGEKTLINTRHIVCVSVFDRGNNMPLMTQLTLVTNHYPKTYESYEDVIRKIIDSDMEE